MTKGPINSRKQGSSKSGFSLYVLSVLAAALLPVLLVPALYLYVAYEVDYQVLLFATLVGAGCAIGMVLLWTRLFFVKIVELARRLTPTGGSTAVADPLGMAERLCRFIEGLEDGAGFIILASRDGRLLYWNDNARRALAYRTDEMPRVEHLFARKEELEALREAANSHTKGTIDRVELLSKDGRRLFASLTVRMLDRDSLLITGVDQTNTVELERRLSSVERELTERIKHLEDFRAGVLSMVRDLEESENRLQQAYMELKSTQAQLVHSSKLKAMGELTAGLAHELTQPLTAIRGFAMYLLRHKDRYREDARKLELINKAAEKMEGVISHLRMFSRIDEEVFKPVDLNRVVEDAFIIAGEMLKTTGIEVVKRLSPLPTIMGNSVTLEQVLINLISNAKDAMPQGGRLTISTDTVEKDHTLWVRLTVEDTGSGIPEDVLPRIFEPFFTTKDVDRGTGLGLSISYGIIKDHGGEILVDSQRGKGTRFTILLPVNR